MWKCDKKIKWANVTGWILCVWRNIYRYILYDKILMNAGASRQCASERVGYGSTRTLEKIVALVSPLPTPFPAS